MRGVMVMLCVGLLSACAQSPDAISPAYTSPVVHNGWSCAQLAEEQARLASALATASQQQEMARSNDIASMIFFGLPLASMSGQNVAPQVARYKGEQEAVRFTTNVHSCNLVDPRGSFAMF